MSRRIEIMHDHGTTAVDRSYVKYITLDHELNRIYVEFKSGSPLVFDMENFYSIVNNERLDK